MLIVDTRQCHLPVIQSARTEGNATLVGVACINEVLGATACGGRNFFNLSGTESSSMAQHFPNISKVWAAEASSMSLTGM